MRLTRAGKILPILNVGMASLAENWKMKTKMEKTRPEEVTPILFDRILNKMIMTIPKGYFAKVSYLDNSERSDWLL